MQAIVTRILSPTDSRGTRVEAKAEGGRVTRPYDPARTCVENHAAAACALADRMDWPAELVGDNPTGRGDLMAWVCVEDSPRA